ncbi:pyridoxamine 5'-phosphate oxidase [Cellulophaga baltica]|jgi:pyridoxamine 5'-phosphate oxidase|uniref:Pyridoxine/pyridoxamine 5'-phosphate oxidase n=1 Tax=Cellulophaga baltica 18 TaxID=1348584 RepID=A0AAU8RG68_9FLAO|nr:pyridoxamine 5'-phosphate oxidase [Cellulophaga baltica]AIY13774.1 pyridoxamine 5'-phosphate oxidase [Cellulophaga baltica NN016038]AIZ42156.1 pyridoxamine 5'-phosphate oxidase [Cellulophaga baltica 18]MCR1024959.1 pyridoxamine 5'-phosphate oxidase [Cellulophaga baltica]WFO17441.1 pyridoxamine 5'-phosphate oxidase [Cellulophaga baltica 4]
MQKDLGGYRKTYEKSELTEERISDNPMELFQKWFYETEASEGVEEPNAMTVSTIGLDGFPKSRVVLLKKYTHEGFIFYTNYDSEKGRAIANNSKVCVSFFWPFMERQIIIKGVAEKIPENLSDGYFESRPDGSKLGAIVSEQSTVIASREVLEVKLKELEKEYETKEILRPKNWGGYIVKPISMEFWQGRPNRLHDRIRFSLENIDWKIDRLAP